MRTAACCFAPTTITCKARPGKETPRLALEPAPVQFRLRPARAPVSRTIEEACLPIGETAWETNGVRIVQTAFATDLEWREGGRRSRRRRARAVFMAKFVFTNVSRSPQQR